MFTDRLTVLVLLQQYSALKSAFILPVLMYVLREVFAENKVDFVKYCVEYDLLTAFHTLSLLHFPLLHFRLCFLLLHFPLLHFPLPHFQRPRAVAAG